MFGIVYHTQVVCCFGTGVHVVWCWSSLIGCLGSGQVMLVVLLAIPFELGLVKFFAITIFILDLISVVYCIICCYCSIIVLSADKPLAIADDDSNRMRVLWWCLECFMGVHFAFGLNHQFLETGQGHPWK